MSGCILCEHDLEQGKNCRFCGLDNKMTKFDNEKKSYEFVWPGLKIAYPARRKEPIKFFVKSNRMSIMKDLEKESIRIAKNLKD